MTKTGLRYVVQPCSDYGRPFQVYGPTAVPDVSGILSKHSSERGAKDSAFVLNTPWLGPVRALDRRRGHEFLPRGTVERLPGLGTQDGKGMEAVVQVKFFGGGAAVWYVTELDPATGEAFGWADLGMGCGELGYMDLGEIGTVVGRLLPMERDLHFKPCTLREAVERKA